MAFLSRGDHARAEPDSRSLPPDLVGRCLGLILALNMLVGIVNLLPVPLFDGHRLMVAGVRNKLAAEAITYVTLAAFVINFLPWIFR